MEMDFASMKRRELQALCKKHGLPANSTNSQMAESLASLLQSQEKIKPKGCLKGSGGSSGDDAGRAPGGPKKVSFSLEEEKLGLDKLEENPDGKQRRSGRRRSVVAPVEIEQKGGFESPVRDLDVPVRTRRSRSLAMAVLWSPVVERKKARMGTEGVRQNDKRPPDEKLASEDEGDPAKSSSEVPATRSLRNRVVVAGKDEGLTGDVEPRKTQKRRRSLKGAEEEETPVNDEGDASKAVMKTSSEVPVTRSLRGRVVMVVGDEGLPGDFEPTRTQKRRRSIKGAEDIEAHLTWKSGENEATEKKDMRKQPEGMVSGREVLSKEGSQRVPPCEEAPTRRSRRNLFKSENSLQQNEKPGTDEAGVEEESLPAGGNFGDANVTIGMKKSQKQGGNGASKKGVLAAFFKPDSAAVTETAPSEAQNGKLSQLQGPPRRSTRSSRRNVLEDEFCLPACDNSADDEMVVEKNKPGKRARKLQSVREVIENSGPMTIAATAPVEAHIENISESEELPRRSTRSFARSVPEAKISLPTHESLGDDVKAVKQNMPRKQARKQRSVRKATENSAPKSVASTATVEARKVSDFEEPPRTEDGISLPTHDSSNDDVKAVKKNRLAKQTRRERLVREATENSAPKHEDATASVAVKLQGEPQGVVLPEEAPKRSRRNAQDHDASLLVDGKPRDDDETVGGNKLRKLPRERGLKRQGAEVSLKMNGNRKRRFGGHQSVEDQSYITRECPTVDSGSVEGADPANSNTFSGRATEVFAADLSVVPECVNTEVGDSKDFSEKNVHVSEVPQSIPVDKIVADPVHDDKLKKSGNAISLKESLQDGLDVFPASQFSEKHPDNLEMAHEAKDVYVPKVVEGSSEVTAIGCSNVEVDGGAEGTMEAVSEDNLYEDNKNTIRYSHVENHFDAQTMTQAIDAESTGSTMAADSSRAPVDTIYCEDHNKGHGATDIICVPLSFSHTKELSLSDITNASPEIDHEEPIAPAYTYDACEAASHVNSCSPIQTNCHQDNTVGLLAKVAYSNSGGLSSVQRVDGKSKGHSSEENDVAKESVLSEVKITFTPTNFLSEEKVDAETGRNKNVESEIEGKVSQSLLCDNLASDVCSDDQVPNNGIRVCADDISNGGLVVIGSSSCSNTDGSDFVDAPVEDREPSSPKFLDAVCDMKETVLEVIEHWVAEDPSKDNKENSPSHVDCIESEKQTQVLEVTENDTESSYPKSVHVSSVIKVTALESPGCSNVNSVAEADGKTSATSERKFYVDNKDVTLSLSEGNKPDRHVEVHEASLEVVEAESYKSTTDADGSFIDELQYKDGDEVNEATSTVGVPFSCRCAELSALNDGEASSRLDHEEPANLADAHIVNETGSLSHNNGPLPNHTIENLVKTNELLAKGADTVTEDSLNLQSDSIDEVGTCQVGLRTKFRVQLTTGGYDVVSGVKENLAEGCDSRLCEDFSVEPRQSFTSAFLLVDTVKGSVGIGWGTNEEERIHAEVRHSLEPENFASDLCSDDKEQDHENDISSKDVVSGSMDAPVSGSCSNQKHSNLMGLAIKVKTVELLVMGANTDTEDSPNLQSGFIDEVGSCQMAPGTLSSAQLSTGEYDVMLGVKESFAEGCESRSCEAFSNELKERSTYAYLLVDKEEAGAGTGRGKKEERIMAESKQSSVAANLASDLCSDNQELDLRNVVSSEDTVKGSLDSMPSGFCSNQKFSNLIGMAVEGGGSFSSNSMTSSEEPECLDDNALFEEEDSRGTLAGRFYEDNRDPYLSTGASNTPEEVATIQEDRCLVTDAEIPAPTTVTSELRENIRIALEDDYGENDHLCDVVKCNLSTKEFSVVSSSERTPTSYNEKPATPLETSDAREMAASTNDCSPVTTTCYLDVKTEGLLADQQRYSKNVERISEEVSVDLSSPQSKLDAWKATDKHKEAFVEVCDAQLYRSPLCKAFSEASDSQSCEVGSDQCEENHAYGLVDKDQDISNDESPFYLSIFTERNVVDDAEITGSGFRTKAANAAALVFDVEFEKGRELGNGNADDTENIDSSKGEVNTECEFEIVKVDADDTENIDSSKGEVNTECGGQIVKVEENTVLKDKFDGEAVKKLDTSIISKGICDIGGEIHTAAITANSSTKNPDYQGSTPRQESIVPSENFASSGKLENVKIFEVLAKVANTRTKESSNLESDSIDEVGECQVVLNTISSAQLATGEDDNATVVKENLTEGSDSRSWEAFSAELKDRFTSANSLVDTAEFDVGTGRGKDEEERIMPEARQSLVPENLASDLCLDGQELDHRNEISSVEVVKRSLDAMVSGFCSNQKYPNVMGMPVDGGEPRLSSFTPVSGECEPLDANALCEEGYSRATFAGQFYEDNKDSPRSPVVSNTPEELEKVQEGRFVVSDLEFSAATNVIPEMREGIGAVCDDIYDENAHLCVVVRSSSTEEFSDVRSTERNPPNSNERVASPLEIPDDREVDIVNNGCSPIHTIGCLEGKTEGLLSDRQSDSKNVGRASGVVSVDMCSPQRKVEECKTSKKLEVAYAEVHSSQSYGSPLCKVFSKPSDAHKLVDKYHEVSSDESPFALTIFEEHIDVNDVEFVSSDHTQVVILESLLETANAAMEVLDVAVERDHELEDKVASDTENIDASEHVVNAQCEEAIGSRMKKTALIDEFDGAVAKNNGTPFTSKGIYDLGGQNHAAASTANSSLKTPDYQARQERILPFEIVASSEKPGNGLSKRDITLADVQLLEKTNTDDTCAEDVPTYCLEYSSSQKKYYLRALGNEQVSDAWKERLLSWECLRMAEKTELGDISYKFSTQVDDEEEISNSSIGRFDSKVHEDPEVAENEIKEKMEVEFSFNDHGEVKEQRDKLPVLRESDEKDTEAVVPFIPDNPLDGAKFESVAKGAATEAELQSTISGVPVCENFTESSEAEHFVRDTSLEAETCCFGEEVAGKVSFKIAIGDYSPSNSGIDAHIGVSECGELKGSSGSDQMEEISSGLVDFIIPSTKKVGEPVPSTPMKLVETFKHHSANDRLWDKENTPVIKMDRPLKRNIEKSVTASSVRRPLKPVQNNNVAGQ